MLAADTDAFLSVGGPFVRTATSSQKNIFELIHAGIGEEECWIVERHDRRTRHDRMPPLFEEAEKTPAYFG
jgi:hypothetical protein